jgi:hypothetical protein
MAVASRGGKDVIAGVIMHTDSETVLAGVPRFLSHAAMDTTGCWCRALGGFLTLTPIDEVLSFLGSVGAPGAPVRRYASPPG